MRTSEDEYKKHVASDMRHGIFATVTKGRFMSEVIIPAMPDTFALLSRYNEHGQISGIERVAVIAWRDNGVWMRPVCISAAIDDEVNDYPIMFVGKFVSIETGEASARSVAEFVKDAQLFFPKEDISPDFADNVLAYFRGDA